VLHDVTCHFEEVPLVLQGDQRATGAIAAGVELVLGYAKIGKSSKLEFFVDNWKTLGPETGGLAGLHVLEIKGRLPTEEAGA
jgi:hypothetical protein